MGKLSSVYDSFVDFILKHKKIVLPVFLVILAVVPLVIKSQYVIRVFCLIGIYCILTLSLNLIAGYMGQSSMGHAALYMMGAYFSGLLGAKLGWPFWITLVFGILGGALGGLILGFATMKLSAGYLSVITLAFGEVVEMVVLNWNSVTNGPLGVRGIPRPNLFGWELTPTNGGFYWLMLVLVIIAVLVSMSVVNSKFGRAVRAIKEDELAAKLMGVHTAAYKVQTIVLSGAMAGMAGAFYASMNRYIDAATFSFDISMTILCIVIFGGMGSIPGMIVGSALLISFPEVLRSLADYRFVVYGLLLILMMRFRPQGLLGGLSRRPYKLPAGVLRPEKPDGGGTEEGKKVS
ncbi:MAG: branched-chain amino acid ABC transporter permease [Lachnospiraceae bacterium]|jgi:branched-chain amino acid transport system permease protein|nr:branched-chain amino acid ABC transporter permease [Lachnospiraceae bacterium]